MKQIAAIFDRTLRVKPMSKIMSFSLALFFAVSVTPAIAGDDNDCVSIPDTAGFPYIGRTYCCNRVESNLPAEAHNAKYGDIIPWDENKGTVKKCLGGRLHDDKWSDEFVSISSTAHEFDEYDFVQKYKLMHYSKFNDTSGKWSTPSRRIDSARYCVPEIGNSVNGKTFCDIRANVLDGVWYWEYLFHTSMNEIRGCDPLDPDSNAKEFDEYISKTTGYPVKIYPEGTVTKSFYATDENGYDTGAYVCKSKYWIAYGFCKESLGKHKLSIEKTYSFNSQIVEGGADDGYHDCLLLTEDSFQETQPVAVQNVDAPIINETQESSESGIKYGYQQCSSNDDCTQEKLSEFLNNKPYLHSTDWYCVEQTPGNKVCAVKACEDEYEPKLGYCAKKVVENIASGNGSAAAETNQTNKNQNDNSNATANNNNNTANADKNDTGKQQESKEQIIKKLTANVDAAYASLSTLTKGLSIWKNADGKFNTARLASDGTAAVVLGTVGGVVTATLVKKNQIKKGFESIQCRVGGHPIGEYGDQININK